MTSWQPISTAPKDGTFVLTAGKKHNSRGPRIIISRFLKLHIDENGHRWRTTGYFEGQSEWSLWHYENPTHWMPLPDPPVPTIKQES